LKERDFLLQGFKFRPVLPFRQISRRLFYERVSGDPGQKPLSAWLLICSYFLRTTVNTDPSPNELSHEICPFNSSRMRRTMASPKPVDGSPSVVCEEILLYFEKRWGSSSAWIPTPSSLTLML